MANNSVDDMWKMQWDAVMNLRILNKSYFDMFERVIVQLSGFVKG